MLTRHALPLLLSFCFVACSGAGNTTYTNGRDSDGNSYNGTVQRLGDSTIYQGRDSNGNSYRKTCNSYGCY